MTLLATLLGHKTENPNLTFGFLSYVIPKKIE